MQSTADDSTLIISISPDFVDQGEEEGFNLVATCNRVLYDWQDIDLSPDLVVSAVTWRAHGDGPGAPAAEVSFPPT